MDTNETREEFLARKAQERKARVDTKLAGVTPSAEDARGRIYEEVSGDYKAEVDEFYENADPETWAAHGFTVYGPMEQA